MDESGSKEHKPKEQSSGVSVLDGTLVSDSCDIGEVKSYSDNSFVEIKGYGILRGRYTDTESGKYFFAISPEGKSLKFLVNRTLKSTTNQGKSADSFNNVKEEPINIPLMEPIFKTFNPLENLSSSQLSVLQGISSLLKGELQGSIGDVKIGKKAAKTKSRSEKKSPPFVPRFIDSPRKLPELNPIMDGGSNMRSMMIHQQPSTTMSEIDQFLKSQNCKIPSTDQTESSLREHSQSCKNDQSSTKNIGLNSLPIESSNSSAFPVYNPNMMRFATPQFMNPSMFGLIRLPQNLSVEQTRGDSSLLSNSAMMSNKPQMMQYFNRIPLNIPVRQYFVPDKNRMRAESPLDASGGISFQSHPSLFMRDPTLTASSSIATSKVTPVQLTNNQQSKSNLLEPTDKLTPSTEPHNRKKSQEANSENIKKEKNDTYYEPIPRPRNKAQLRFAKSRIKVSYEGFDEFLANKKLKRVDVKNDMNLRKTLKLEWTSLSDEQRKRYKNKHTSKTESLQKFKCALSGCNNMAISKPDRGGFYCSDDCLVKHCKITFKNWVKNLPSTGTA